MTTSVALRLPIRTRTANHLRRDHHLAILLLLPAALAVLVVMIIPLGFALFASFYDYSLGQQNGMVFVFFGNYVRFFTDPIAIQSLVNTLIFTAISLIACLSLGVGISVMLKDLPRGVANFLRGIYAMPVLISPIIVGLIWRYMYDPTYGFVYYLLGFVGLEDFGGLTSSASALLCIVVADVWHATPFIILVASAGLTVIPDELYEAAYIDGASSTKVFFYITLPLLWKILTVLILIRGTDAFRIFDLVYGLTGGGPANSTTSLSVYAFKEAFENNQMGFAMAVSMITLICLIVLFGPFMRNSARSGSEE